MGRALDGQLHFFTLSLSHAACLRLTGRLDVLQGRLVRGYVCRDMLGVRGCR